MIDPIDLLNDLLTNKYEINDELLLIMSKILIHNNINYFIKNNIFLLISNKILTYPLTYKLFIKLYEASIYIYTNMSNIIIFFDSLKINYYIHKCDSTQTINYLKSIKSLINSIFDDNYGGHNFLIKIRPNLKKNIYSDHFYIVTSNEIVNRLKLLHQMLGSTFFTTYSIKTYRVSDFNLMKYDDKCKYYHYMYEITKQTINKVEESINYVIYYQRFIHSVSNINITEIYVDSIDDTNIDFEDIVDILNCK
jgi:hypothetical protein